MANVSKMPVRMNSHKRTLSEMSVDKTLVEPNTRMVTRSIKRENDQ
jgi:hypothetical protein